MSEVAFPLVTAGDFPFDEEDEAPFSSAFFSGDLNAAEPFSPRKTIWVKIIWQIESKIYLATGPGLSSKMDEIIEKDKSLSGEAIDRKE